MTREEFVQNFGGIYEHSPWVAEAVFDQGIDQDLSLDVLAKKMAVIVDGAGYDQQLALLRAHPDLAGRLAVRGELDHFGLRSYLAIDCDRRFALSMNDMQITQTKIADHSGECRSRKNLADVAKARGWLLKHLNDRGFELGEQP